MMKSTSRNPSISAASLSDSSLPVISQDLLCTDHIQSFCTKGDRCQKSHRLCLLDDTTATTPALDCSLNQLSKLPRMRRAKPFEDDGPGDLSDLGPRHDNDHVEIHNIRILPTVDEVLCQRSPYIPSRDPCGSHRLPLGQARLFDINFRQLRYEHVEPIIDCCYHASQHLSELEGRKQLTDYDERSRTPKGTHYSLFQDVRCEEVMFNDQKGIMVRFSYACPSKLRGRRMGLSTHLEKGMLVGLVGLANGSRLSITFMEISQRQTTEAMKQRTGNDLRASIILSFAEPMDTSAIRRVLYNFQGILREKFALVELPGALLAGFKWTLEELQTQSSDGHEMALGSIIAPLSAPHSPVVPPPDYAIHDNFQFKLDILRKDQKGGHDRPSLAIKPSDVLSDETSKKSTIDRVSDETSLDYGQATALCESLCRSMAFTQGPPGTGKTYLGVALARVLLASRPPKARRPILLVCLTNHALDSFLGGLCEAGIAGLVRFGSNSKEDWTKPFQVRTLSSKFNRTKDERAQISNAKSTVDGHAVECQSWCEALNSDALSWPAVREYLQLEKPSVLSQFTAVEKTNKLRVSDIRLARKTGGFAFEFWCKGGDIKDVDVLLETFKAVLGKRNGQTIDTHPFEAKQVDNLVENIRWNIVELEMKNINTDIWKLPLLQRQELVKQWKQEIGLETILDRTAEAHRRHQVAIVQKRQVFDEVDIRMLQGTDIIAMTTTACAKNRSMLTKLSPQIVMCEEAGEVMEAQFLCTLMPSVNHHISIGDPLQLRPQVNEQNLSLETAQGAKFRLDESLMERLMLPRTPGSTPIPSSKLTVQRRMHPEIADLMRATLYPYLQDHESTRNGRCVNGMVDRVWWLDHQVPEDGDNMRTDNPTSCSNAFEVEMIAGLVHYLVDSNEYDYKDITILTPYNGQLAALTSRLKGQYSLWLSEKDREALCEDGLMAAEDVDSSGQTDVDVGHMLRLATIDNFQGEESKIVILSLVRSNGAGRLGFMKTENRINVACSRARNGLYIIGNATLMKTVPMWNQITTMLTTKAKIGPEMRTRCPRHPDIFYSIKEPSQWYEIPPCQEICDFKFPCGHQCGMTCHATAIHDRMGCTKPCEKSFGSCGHQCFKLCGQPCGECTCDQVSAELPCDHNAMLDCSEAEGGATETEVLSTFKLASTELTCGHEHDILCSDQQVSSVCNGKCGKFLECGHPCEGICSSCTYSGSHPVCGAICGKKHRLCDHECISKCHPGTTCQPCQQPCLKTCKHRSCTKKCSGECESCLKDCDWTCEHRGPCASPCGLPCTRFPCQEACPKELACGHRCPTLCGENCPDICLQCQSGSHLETTQIFLSCGHHFDVNELDSHVGFQQLYDVDKRGRILSTKPSISGRTINATCPSCGQSCASTRRYALHRQLETFPIVLDSISTRFSREIANFLDLAYSTKLSLDSGFRTFQDCLKPGPLNGRNNLYLIQDRSTILNDLRERISSFKDNVVTPFESGMAALAKFLPEDAAFHTSIMSTRVRLDSISARCRLIILEDRLKCISVLGSFANQSSHTPLLIEALRGLTITEAQQELSLLNSFIQECETKGLKRLECEAQLIWTCFQLVLRKLGVCESNIIIQEILQKVRQLCQAWPDSAGLLLPICRNVQKSVDPSREETETFYDWKYKNVFWTLSEHKIGALTKCSHGHLYSGITWSSCPECGHEVKVPDNHSKEPARAGSLNTDAFLQAMKALPTTFNANAYRRKPLEDKKSANRLLGQEEGVKIL